MGHKFSGQRNQMREFSGSVACTWQYTNVNEKVADKNFVTPVTKWPLRA
jgi:hypothetical protein